MASAKKKRFMEILKDITADEIFEILFNFVAKISAESSIEKQLLLLSELGKKVTQSDRCSIWVRDHSNHQLWTMVEKVHERIIIPDTLGVVGQSTKKGEELVINDALSDSRFNKNIDEQSGYRTRNLLIIPLRDSVGKIIGAFQAINKLSQAKDYSAIDVNRARFVAAYVGKQLEACLLYNEIRISKEALSNSQERLKLILESTNDGFWDWEVGEDKLFASSNWCNTVLGQDKDVTFSQLARDCAFSDDRLWVEEYLKNNLSKENPAYEVEYRLKNFSGKWIWVEERGRVIEWADNFTPSRILGTFKNITIRKESQLEKERLESQLQHVQRLESLGLMAGGVAHDFNNMLATIMGNAELAVLELSNDSPAHSCLQEIQKAAMRSSDLNKQLLNYSGKGQFVIEPCNLNDLIKEISALVKASLSKKSEIKFNLDENLLLIECDLSQVRQIVMNLIINASDSLEDEAGQITISTGIKDYDFQFFSMLATDQEKLIGKKYAFLKVEDTGKGMDEDTIERIFDPFFSTKGAGRGLGLASVLGIVRGHGGGIRVESRLGVGTAFYVLFPCLPDEKQIPLIPKKDIDLPLEAPCSGTILVADDEKSVRILTERMLKKAGYEVISAPDGKEAIKLFTANSEKISLVLLDMNMPVLGGLEALEQLKKIDPKMPVVLMSGYAEVPAKWSGVSPDDFLGKPFQRIDLLNSIGKLIALKE